jgi:PmbA protein
MSQPPANREQSAVTADRKQLVSVVEMILSEAQRLGASAAEAGVSDESGLEVTVRMGEVETLEYHRDRGLGVTVYFGQRKASASTSDLSSAAIKSTVQAACDIARYTAEDDCAGLADKSLLATDIPDLDLFHPWDMDAERAIVIARECEDAARNFDKLITNTEGATVSSHSALRIYANSNGFVGGYPSSRHSMSCAVIGGAGEGMQRDYWYTVARDPSELQSARSVGERAAQRTIRRLNARRLSTRKAPVLFAADVAAGLLGHFVGAIRGGSLYRKASFLLDQLGKPVFAPHVHIHEQPHLHKALGSAPFDSEGVATQARDVVRDGILQGYVLDSYAARKLKMQTTGNAGGVHNLTLDSGGRDFDGLLADLGTGLLVTELMGHGVNNVTGDYSRGAAGFWVENGAIQYPVEEITIAGNLRDMYRNLVAVGTDIEIRGSIRTGSILLASMTIAGE